MWLSDVSVKRPVLASVLNLLLIVFGLFSLSKLSVREYPDIDPPIVSVRTNYTGASAQVVESQITQLIEERIAGIEGIRRITSSSRDGRSDINIEFDISRDIDAAANDVRDSVSRVLNNLPDQADPPEVAKANSDARPIMWLVLTSDTMNRLELSDYAARYLEDRFATVSGVSQIYLGGEREPAMRVWLDRSALAARQLTVEDIEDAIEAQNTERPAGRLESERRDFSLRTLRPFRTTEDFEQLVVAHGADGYPVRLADVARVEVGPVEPRGVFRANGANALGIGIVKQSTANALEVTHGVREEMQRIRDELPKGTHLAVNYDSSLFVEASLHEVLMTLLYATLAVVTVIWLFLGSVRATLIPAVTVPISLIASFIFLQLFGFSINILTLLALVLAIGLVVDDAIVVVENIHRRLEEGEPPRLAAYRGAREVGFAVIATTAVLVAVLTPVAFLQGNIGRLFAEFALALAGSVVCSSIVALTLSPALAAALLKPGADESSSPLERLFSALERRYRSGLGKTLARPWIAFAVLIATFGGIAGLMSLIPSELTPSEDRGSFFVRVVGPEGASAAATSELVNRIEPALLDDDTGRGIERVLLRMPGFGSDEFNQAVFIVALSDWSQRNFSTDDVVERLDKKFSSMPGAQVTVLPRQGLGSGNGQPVQIIIGGPSYEVLRRWQDKLLAYAATNPGLTHLDGDFKATKPQIEIEIDLQRAADLGIPVESVASALETFFGGRRVTTYQDRGEEYDVILQASDADRRDPSALSDVYVRAANDALVPLSGLIRTRENAAAPRYNRVDRMRAITISANLAPGYKLGEALSWFQQAVRDELPPEARLSYGGDSREFMESGQALYLTFFAALLIVYLVLAAQFENWLHPVVILTTVPLTVFGALGGLLLMGMTLNIYSQIGIIMLVGLAAKNGILIVEFINQRRDSGTGFRQAILEASSVRLRPILMTSISTIAGAVPLIIASGAGAEARQLLGVVIFFGVAFATLMTLFVVPTFYELLCRRTGSPERHSKELEAQATKHPLDPHAAAS